MNDDRPFSLYDLGRYATKWVRAQPGGPCELPDCSTERAAWVCEGEGPWIAHCLPHFDARTDGAINLVGGPQPRPA